MRSYDLSHSQFFPSEAWVPLAHKLQRAQAEGRGIVVSERLTTVSNEFYGIPAGHEVTIVWVYLGRVAQWEARLSEEMQVLYYTVLC